MIQAHPSGGNRPLRRSRQTDPSLHRLSRLVRLLDIESDDAADIRQYFCVTAAGQITPAHRWRDSDIDPTVSGLEFLRAVRWLHRCDLMDARMTGGAR